MKKGISDIVQRLSGWGDEPDYELLEISDNGDNISIVVKKDNIESKWEKHLERGKAIKEETTENDNV